MTKELMKLSARELREFQNAVEIVKKAYGCTDEDIDNFFFLVKRAKEFLTVNDELDKRVQALEKSINGEAKVNSSKLAEKLMGALNRKTEGYKL